MWVTNLVRSLNRDTGTHLEMPIVPILPVAGILVLTRRKALVWNHREDMALLTRKLLDQFSGGCRWTSPHPEGFVWIWWSLFKRSWCLSKSVSRVNVYRVTETL